MKHHLEPLGPAAADGDGVGVGFVVIGRAAAVPPRSPRSSSSFPPEPDGQRPLGQKSQGIGPALGRCFLSFRIRLQSRFSLLPVQGITGGFHGPHQQGSYFGRKPSFDHIHPLIVGEHRQGPALVSFPLQGSLILPASPLEPSDHSFQMGRGALLGEGKQFLLVGLGGYARQGTDLGVRRQLHMVAITECRRLRLRTLFILSSGSGSGFSLVGRIGEGTECSSRRRRVLGRSLPTAWTTVAVADPFVALSAGRSLFRIEDLVSLVTLVKKVSASLDECKEDSTE